MGAGLLKVKDFDLLKDLGLTEDVANTFAKVADIAATLASVIPFVNIAAGLVSVFASFGGSDPMRDLVIQEFNRLFARLDQDKRDELNNYVADCIAAFDAELVLLDPYRIELSKPKKYAVASEQENIRQRMIGNLPHMYETLGGAMSHKWAMPLDPIAYHDNWGVLTHTSSFFTLPKSGAPIPANLPADAVPFDHRPMVQLLVYGLQSYLTVIKAISPEYRTTGAYSAALLKLADKLSPRLDDMRSQTLALTIYKPGIPYFAPGPRQWFVLGVGAMDLRADTDDFMRQASRPADHPVWDRSANLYRAWTSAPAIDTRGYPVRLGAIDFWTINPVAVDLANQQSERDYAAVLMRSGYFTLAHLEALLRHLSTEPDRSETVTGSVGTWRKPRAAFPATVKADPIPFSPAIAATASREPQECKAYLTLTTQPFPHDLTIGYRLRLLTLPNGTTETPFDWYVWNTYVPQGDGSRNWKLQVNENAGLPLDPVGENERLLMDCPSPAQPVQQEGVVRLTADTFDWYVPVSDNPIRIEQIRAGIRVSAIGTGPQPMPLPSPPPAGDPPAITRWNMESLVTQPDVGIGAFGWDEGGQTWKGEKREWKRTQVELTYKLYWHEDQLSILLTARPEDRNFVAYLVVEEYLPQSQQYLRTPIEVPFNGQLTYVPQRFFDAEAKARKHANEIIGRIERNYSISRQPGPGDPVTGWLRPGVLQSSEAMNEFVDLARQHAPEIVEQAVAEVRGQTGS